MKNILLLIPYGSVGGMERLAYNFYNFYKDRGFNVKVIKLIQQKTDIINFDGDEIGLSERDFYQMSFFSRFFFYVKIPFLIRSIVKKNKIDHSISFGDMCNVFSSLTFTREHKVASIHALKSVEFVNKSFLNSVFKLSYKTSYKAFDKVVCISNAIKQDIINNCQYKFISNLKVIYNPHDIKNIEKMAAESLDSVDEEILFNSKVVLFLGRISHQKAPWHLVNAFNLLAEENNGVKLVLIGDGNSEVTEYLERIVIELSLQKKVFFLGRKNNPYKYLKRANILALTSYYEGTPNVIVEAIACDTPIVSSNCTDGILELMSSALREKRDKLIITESGYITPTFFKGSLAIPHNFEFSEEEEEFANALNNILKDESIKLNLVHHKDQLLRKFNLEHVCLEYIK